MEADTNQKTYSPLQLAALMALFFTAMGVAAISPAMAKLAAHFSGYDYALISTMPTLFIVPSTLWAGAAAGKTVSYRTLSTVGIALFLAGGLAPFFLPDSFVLLLVCRAVAVITLLTFLHQLFSYPVLMNMSLLFEAKGAGGATAAAAALSLFTVGGCAVGFAFGGLFHRLRRFTVALGYLFSALGAGILCFGGGAAVLILGSVVLGMASNLISLSGYAIMAQYIPPRRASLCISIVMGVGNLGGFLCPFLLRALSRLLGECLFSNLYLLMAEGCLWAAVFALADPLPRDAL